MRVQITIRFNSSPRMDEIRGKDRVILALEKELGVQTGQTQKLLLQKEALDEQLVQVKEAERYHSSPKRELPPGIGDMAELMGIQDQHMDERDVRRFQLKIAELNSVIRKLEDRNTLLADERNELLKRSRETEVQLKPLVEKNKRMNKKNEDLLQSIQRMEEKIKNLTRENVEMKEKLSAQASLKRHTSLNDLSLTRDEQEIEFLRLQVLEQRHVIDDLSLERERLLRSKRHRGKSLKPPKVSPQWCICPALWPCPGCRADGPGAGKWTQGLWQGSARRAVPRECTSAEAVLGADGASPDLGNRLLSAPGSALELAAGG
ncbi:hypothetical protein GH733_005983 [Mirounga leonina]|nr:hypothetical protein GH733_005983 [Mirounga leonina]